MAATADATPLFSATLSFTAGARVVSTVRVVLPILVALSGSACTSNPPASDEPDIRAVSISESKGAPYGRSDSAEPYMTLARVATDPTYGYTKQNPVKLAGASFRDGPNREAAYLNGLRGPAGQHVEYERLGSCCPFETPNGPLGGMLDAFRLTYEGQAEPITLYLNFYDPGEPLVPVGLTAR